MIDNKKLWDSVLAELELSVSKPNFNTWFKDTKIIDQNDGMVMVSVPNNFAKEWLQNKFHKPILKSLRTYGENIRGVEYTISKEEPKRREEHVHSMPTGNPLPLQDYYVNKDDNLNPRYTFETFVIGPFNELAHAAAQAIVKNPGAVYNPLYLYGNSGHGKTHLIQAVGNKIKQLFPQKKVFYVTSEKFALDYINSVQANKVNAFKEKYRIYDVLIMDDIQFFSNTEKTQEEVFHLFNDMHDRGRQIIFSCDKHPNYIPNLQERLKTRFSAGMLVDIPAPDQESRTAILKTKLSQHRAPLAPEIIDYLAQTIDGNIRELEGVVNTIVLQWQLKGRELNIMEVKNLVKNSSKPKKMISIKDVIKTIANFYNVEEASIYEKSRRKEVVKPRQIIMYILREDLDVSYPSIGEKMGGRDHTTVIHSCEKIKNEIRENAALAQELKQIRALI